MALSPSGQLLVTGGKDQVPPPPSPPVLTGHVSSLLPFLSEGTRFIARGGGRTCFFGKGGSSTASGRVWSSTASSPANSRKRRETFHRRSPAWTRRSYCVNSCAEGVPRHRVRRGGVTSSRVQKGATSPRARPGRGPAGVFARFRGGRVGWRESVSPPRRGGEGGPCCAPCAAPGTRAAGAAHAAARRRRARRARRRARGAGPSPQRAASRRPGPARPPPRRGRRLPRSSNAEGAARRRGGSVGGVRARRGAPS